MSYTPITWTGVCVCMLHVCVPSVTQSCPTLCSWTVARQAPRPLGFSRQKNWSGLHFFLQGIFPTQGSNPQLLHFLPGRLTAGPPGKPTYLCSSGLLFFFFNILKNIDEHTQKRRDSKKLVIFTFFSKFLYCDFFSIVNRHCL